MMEVPIVEIFSSLQGEGPYSGDKHVFVRFKNCNIHCTYCDELKTESTDMTVDEVVDEIKRLESLEGPHQAVSWTGGEPLLYSKFLKEAMQEIHQNGDCPFFKNYLETSGILPKSLKEVIDETDIVAMDMKLPSVTGEKSFWREHEDFLKESIKKDVFVKMVLSSETDMEEFDLGVDIIQKISPETLLVLQPLSTDESPQGTQETLEFLEQLKQRALGKIPHVQIKERLHKILGIR